MEGFYPGGLLRFFIDQDHQEHEASYCVDDDDLIYEILQRLPIEALLRFKSVCKPWKKMIEDPYLALKKLRKITHEDTDVKLLMVHYSMSGTKELTAAISKEMIEIGTPENQGHHLACDCNGLYLFYQDTDQSLPLSLFNPVTKETIQLPHASTSAHSYKHIGEVHGLGFDVGSAVFKVIRFTMDIDYVCRKPEILTLGQKSWKQLELPAFLHGMPYKGTAFVNGAIHCALKIPDSKNHILLLSFDVMKEEFRVINFPYDIPVSRCRLVNIGGSLAMILGQNDADPESFSVYLLKDYNKGQWCVESGRVNKSAANKKKNDMYLVYIRVIGNQIFLSTFESVVFFDMETRQEIVESVMAQVAKLSPMLVNAPLINKLTLLPLSQYRTSDNQLVGDERACTFLAS